MRIEVYMHWDDLTADMQAWTIQRYEDMECVWLDEELANPMAEFLIWRLSKPVRSFSELFVDHVCFYKFYVDQFWGESN